MYKLSTVEVAEDDGYHPTDLLGSAMLTLQVEEAQLGLWLWPPQGQGCSAHELTRAFMEAADQRRWSGVGAALVSADDGDELLYDVYDLKSDSEHPVPVCADWGWGTIEDALLALSDERFDCIGYAIFPADRVAAAFWDYATNDLSPLSQAGRMVTPGYRLVVFDLMGFEILGE
jgi:hypothetical protein